MMKVSEYLKFIKAQVNNYYWYGTIGQTASVQLYNDRKAAYPKQYTANDYKDQIAHPKPCFDCAGLVKSPFVYPKYNAADDLGATGLYGKCTVKGALDKNILKPGYLVFKGNSKTKSLVGVYIGNDEVIEAKGHAYGVICSKLSENNWSYYAEYYNIDYDEATPEPAPDPDTEPYCEHLMTVDTQTDPLRLREGPGTDYPVLYRMPKGSQVVWHGVKSGDWLKVLYRNQWGWAHKDYLKIC